MYCEVTGESHAAGPAHHADLLPPTGQRQQLQGHSVSLYADLDSSLWAAHFPLLCKATLVLLQQADAFLIPALQRTNHSSAERTAAITSSVLVFCVIKVSFVFTGPLMFLNFRCGFKKHFSYQWF